MKSREDLERELDRTRRSLHLMTEAYELLREELRAKNDLIERLALDLHCKEIAP